MMSERVTMCPEGHPIEWSQWQANGASYGSCGGEGCPTTWKWDDGELFPTPGSGETWLRNEVRRLRAALAQLTTERDELQATFDLRWRADQRAIASWHAQHPGSERTWPDHADLVVWLRGQLDEAESEVARLTKERDVANLACDLSEQTDLHAQAAATWKERAERAEAACAEILQRFQSEKGEPPYDGIPCPACPWQMRNLQACAHNLMVTERDSPRFWRKLEELKRAVALAQPLFDAHFADSRHAHSFSGRDTAPKHGAALRRWVQDIARERAAQDEQWGGPEHDDSHDPGDWFDYISKQVWDGRQARRAMDSDDYRERLVKIAALAVAALESYDRLEGHGTDA